MRVFILNSDIQGLIQTAHQSDSEEVDENNPAESRHCKVCDVVQVTNSVY